jgi:hypothetical protein
MQRDGQQVRVGHLPVPRNAGKQAEWIVRGRDAVLPEVVPARCPEPRQEVDRLGGRASIGNRA